MDDLGVEMPGLTCRFQGRTSIARMEAELFDAACQADGRLRQTRFFVNRSATGVTLVSREFGTFVLDACR